MTAHVCGIDLGKTVFHLVGLSKEGHVVLKKRLSRKQLISLTVNMPCCLIGMEACAGAHFLARVLRAQGHEVKLMPAEYVRPFVKSNKNDYVDAEAIAEAVQQPTTLCPDQERSSAGSSSSSPRARSLDGKANGRHQPDSGFHAGAWNHDPDWAGSSEASASNDPRRRAEPALDSHARSAHRAPA